MRRSSEKTAKPQTAMAYPWKYGSCWLDTSLNILYWVVSGNWDDFASCFSSQPAESTMHILRLMFELRNVIDSERGHQDISQCYDYSFSFGLIEYLFFYFSFLFMTHFVYLMIRHHYVILLRIRHRLLSLRHIRHRFVIRLLRDRKSVV